MNTFETNPLAALSLLGGGETRVSGGITFLRQGHPVDHLYCLLEGTVRVEASDWDDRTLLICFSRPPTFFGDVEVFTGTSEATCTLTTVGPARFWRMDLNRLRTRLTDHPWITAELARGLAVKLTARARESARNLLSPLAVRYEAYLREMGAEGRPVPIALADTSALLATTPRHLQRVIAGLVATGRAERRGRSLVIPPRPFAEVPLPSPSVR